LFKRGFLLLLSFWQHHQHCYFNNRPVLT
jgi:hypothetical protein